MSRSPLPFFLFALVLVAPSPSWAQPSTAYAPISDIPLPNHGTRAGTGSLYTDILPANDPIAARMFLDGPSYQAELKARSPEKFEAVYARAAELKDMEDILYSPRTDVTLRMALVERPNSHFCQRSKTMFEWIDKYIPELWKDRRKELRTVYWEWDQLKPLITDWLTEHGTTESDWDALDLSHRRDKLEGWAKEESAAIMALNPRSKKEADAMAERIRGVDAVMNAGPLWDRLAQVRTGLSGLERVKEMLSKIDDPAAKKAYQDALSATTPEARLAALSTIFDGQSPDLAAVRALAPAGPGQTFDPRSRQLVAGLLASGVMRETDGTYAGQELRDFFATHPMKIDVAPTKRSSTLAWYDGGVLHFNEEYVAQYVKSQRRTLDDLGKDPALLQPLVREIAPIFVHEATHQRQDVFAAANGIPFFTGEAAEKEAMMTEALFVLQKQKNDPSYAAFLAAGQDRSKNIRAELTLSRRLEKDRADWFGESVMATHYPEWLSISGQVWCRILWHNRIGPPLEAELARRAALPAAERARLDGGRDFKADDAVDQNSFVAALPSIGTARLKTLYESQKRASEKAPEAYAAYVKRLKDVTALTDARLDALSAPSVKKDRVPAPFEGRNN